MKRRSGPTCRSAPGGRLTPAFTLIEVLVVVAVIALLVAILLPSLSRAKQQARMVQCQANARQLAGAFVMYSAANRNRLPGSFFDDGADWLGRANRRNAAGALVGRDPEDGTVFRYMSRDARAYSCPDDDRKSKLDAWYCSYSGNLILSGAKPEMLAYAHYRQAAQRGDPLNFSETDHRAAMRRAGGVPLIVEEDAIWGLKDNDEGGWSNTDSVSDRHLHRDGFGYGVLGYVDGSAGRVPLPPRRNTADTPRTFHANSLCVRAGRKWVSGLSFWSPATGLARYGMMDRAESAESRGVRH